MGNMKEIEVKIPNLGEAEETEVIEVSVAVGDMVSLNDPLIVLESEKAAMEVPSDHDGKVKEINIKEGQSVKEGDSFLILEIEESIEKKPEPIVEETVAEKKSTIASEIKTEVIKQDFSGINAGPAVRKIARELEIDLSKINGTGNNSMITKEDLKKYIHSSGETVKNHFNDIETIKEYGEYRLEKQSKIKLLGAENLYNSWVSIPHVSHFEEIDVTLIEQQRAEINKKSKIKITPLAYLVLNLVKALKEFPIFNSSLIGKGELMVREYFNVGIAVDTPDGLLVPVIKDADKLTMNEIASEIIELANRAKNKKLLQKNLKGGTFSISSLGSMGGTGFTPIINPPEVGILGVSRTKKIVSMTDEGNLVEKTMLPITLSYDHRVINGADAGKFMNFLKSEIEKGI